MRNVKNFFATKIYDIIYMIKWGQDTGDNIWFTVSDNLETKININLWFNIDENIENNTQICMPVSSETKESITQQLKKQL